MTSSRRFPPPWEVEQIPRGFKVLDANGQALAYIYACETRPEADLAKVLTLDEARRIAVNVARLPGLLGASAQFAAPRHCPICNYRGEFFPFGLYYVRPDARCGRCGSLERHRLLYLCLRKMDGLPANPRVLHFAPQAAVGRFIKPLASEYVSADLLRKDVDHNWNIEQIDCDDNSFDVVICSHVLEHVDADRALAEIKRVLNPDGVAFLMIPICEGLDHTYENPDAAQGTNIDRWMNFQQADHVRIFGRDFRDKVRSVGFNLSEYVAEGTEAVTYGLVMGERVFIARSAGPLPPTSKQRRGGATQV